MFEMIAMRTHRNMGLIRRDIDSFFDQSFDGSPFGCHKDSGEWMHSVDIPETGKDVIIKAEVAGIDPKDIDISINDDLLTIRGKRKKAYEDKDQHTCRMERSYGAFSRALRLPSEVDAEKIEATYQNGVLSIHLPKTRVKSAKKIEVKAA